MVRINQGRIGLKDLEAVIPHNVHVILIPKVEEAKQIKGDDYLDIPSFVRTQLD